MKAATLWALLLIFATSTAAQTHNNHPDSALIITSDVENFWRAYDQLGPTATRGDSIQIFTHGYFDRASPGLEAFNPKRIDGPENLVEALGRYPRYYAAIRSNTLRLRESERNIREAMHKLKELYPDAVFPDVYFVIGRLMSSGTQGRLGLIIGAEMVSADDSTPTDELPEWAAGVTLTADVLPCLVVHELVHYQQQYAASRSLLRQTLREGVADFLTTKAAGCRATPSVVYSYGEQHEHELWLEFQEEMFGTDYSRWLYNGLESSDRPANLGYWMGYQVAEAYYAHAEDKRQAIYDLLHIRNFQAILTASRYAEQFEE